MKKTLKYVLATATLVMSLGALASCGGGGSSSSIAGGSSTPDSGSTSESSKPHWDFDKVERTYNTFTVMSPSNWNELTYQDENDTQIMSYISGGLFNFDFKFDENDEIVPGEFTLQYDGATGLEDVTADYAGNNKYAVPADAKKGDGYAYKITLRDDLKWDDGTAITAKDFVRTAKELLDPKFKNFRADQFYNGETVLHGARDYVYQGVKGFYGAETIYSSFDIEKQGANLTFSLGNKTENAVVQNTTEDKAATVKLRDYFVSASATAAQFAGVLEEATAGAITATELLTLNNKTLKDIWATPALKTVWDKFAKAVGLGANEELLCAVTYYEYPEFSWENVGMIKGATDQELILILDNPLQLLNEDGSLYYKAAYNMASLPLVHEGKYNANKVEPVTGSNLWTSTYNSSVASTASWGPYKLTSFQSGKEYKLERNPYWYGYNKEENYGKYQADQIVCKTMKEFNLQFQAFQKGQIDEIGIDVSIADDYKGSSRAMNTPSDFVQSMQLQSNVDALKERGEKDGVNKTILGNVKFRKALSLGVDRVEYTNKCTTSGKPGLGLFNTMHYYDVANGGVYRNTDEAKKVLCNTYGVKVEDYATLDDAVAAVTGYDPTQAKDLLTQAYNEELAAGRINATQHVSLEFGTGEDNEATRRHYNYLTAAFKKLAEGTPLEGRLDFTFSARQKKWASDFRAGAYDICLGGWSGAAWNPGYFLAAYVDKANMYSQSWDTEAHMLELTIPSISEEPIKQSLMSWWRDLNGAEGMLHNLTEGAVDQSVRLQVISAMEQEVLGVYYTVPLINSFSSSLQSYKIESATDEYNTFMSYGGLKYLSFNYTDAEWDAYVAKQGGTLDYKK